MDNPASEIRSTVGQWHHKCINADYSILLLPVSGMKLYGVFDFQVIFGIVDVNGYVFHSKKFSAKNFFHASVPVYHVPLFLCNVPSPTISNENEDSLAVLTSRLRDLVDNPAQLAERIIAVGKGLGVVVLRHKCDDSSDFIAQQHHEYIFRAPPRSVYAPLSDGCCCLVNSDQPADSDLSRCYQYSMEELHAISGILERICKSALVFSASENNTKFSDQNDKAPHSNCVLVIGNKGAGKSTLMRFLMNSMLSRTDFTSKIFLLDTDVGQAELTPSGLISLHEITQPIFGASFANQRSTLSDSFFYGSNSPSVDFGFYIHLLKRCLERFKARASPDSILFINTVGWIDGLGYDLMCSVISAVQPSIIVNVTGESIINFEVPMNYHSLTSSFKRITRNSDTYVTYRTTPAVLRSFNSAGYFGLCSPLRVVSTSSDEVRLADVRPYRVNFTSVALYFHPELAPVTDNLVFAALNCAVVALCTIDLNDENFDRRRVKDDEMMPERITVKLLDKTELATTASQKAKKRQKIDNTLPQRKQATTLPVLRCFGYGMIRAIDVERRLFYVLTPVNSAVLRSVNVFGLGHELQTPEILFDQRSNERTPYLVELGKVLSQNHQKFYSPLRNVTGVKRYISRGGGGGGTNTVRTTALKHSASFLRKGMKRKKLA